MPRKGIFASSKADDSLNGGSSQPASFALQLTNAGRTFDTVSVIFFPSGVGWRSIGRMTGNRKVRRMGMVELQ
jgi:hypothetical protein